MTTVRDAWVLGAARLADAGIDSARLDARVLLAHVMNLEPGDTLRARALSDDELARFDALLERRARHEPVAYITGMREFWSLPFAVGPGVLVPRPESETLLEEVLKAFPDRTAALDVVDLGTGSGCLLLGCLSSFPNARGTGVDVSPKALDWAKRNADRLGMASRITWRACDWTEADLGAFDVLLCNPPYLRDDEREGLAPDVRLYEPAEALFGGPDGLGAYRMLATLLPMLLKSEGRAFLEIGAGQEAEVRVLLEASALEIVHVAPDLAGIPRCIVAGRKAPG